MKMRESADNPFREETSMGESMRWVVACFRHCYPCHPDSYELGSIVIEVYHDDDSVVVVEDGER
jgi:hypothetical protein